MAAKKPTARIAKAPDLSFRPRRAIGNNVHPKVYSNDRKGKIAQKGDAIRRKLDSSNNYNRDSAEGKAEQSGKSTTYNTQRILGKKEGFSDSDFGVGAGAGIPYQIKTEKKTAGPRSAENRRVTETRTATKPNFAPPKILKPRPSGPTPVERGKAAVVSKEAIRRKLAANAPSPIFNRPK